MEIPQPLAAAPFPSTPVPPSGAPPVTGPSAWPAAAPTQVTAGTIIARSFGAWWRTVWKLSLLYLGSYLPVFLGGLIGGFLTGATGQLGQGGDAGTFATWLARPTFFVPLAIGGLVTLVLFVVVTGGLVHGVLGHLAGGRVEVGAMFRLGFRRLWPVFGATFLFTLLVGVSLMVLIVPGVIVGSMLALAIPVAAIEQVGPAQALGRSAALTKGYRLPLFLAFLAVTAIYVGASLLGNLLGTVLPIVGVLISLAVNLACASLPSVLAAVAYHDLRLAKEGVDTSALARVFE
jgi:hypothetical protein